ncbi:hypothetical protein SELMODRAFT_183449 [Selaginella moellendorffii]|uniref:protein-serine/threonine phosphatase n=1 Tax=Selaginella moellendorffii TaxID=88036 RepID=D8SX07_SELML|nr:probable protein phosphatase 2C 60 [Selaginella moellendorffii]EFJ11182.1 hypothetical protein SELMODRAFT_183449 [Selaginella moellendorffii]|eukprot:XP_002987879.1 probable protein phosphatase 2C 60 [Selaginella moellendorffii]
MLARLSKMVVGCWKRVEQYVHIGATVPSRNDALLWFHDIGKHAFGDFSIAVVQANSILEDHTQIETGPGKTFVGVYDGHGGPEAAQYINNHLWQNLQRLASQEGDFTSDVLRRAILSTEDGFERYVAGSWALRPQIATVGSCCLVGLIRGNQLFVANLGDSRAVMGTFLGRDNRITAIQLSAEHNASIDAVRQELKDLHPDDSHIVVLRHGVWRVKGIIQVTKSIGDVYLKKAEFNREPLIARFRLPQPLERPVLTAEPSISVFTLRPADQFLIFASDGLWEHLSSQEAVDIVYSHPRAGIARRLIKAALQEAARKREMRYLDLIRIERGVRRHFHDDITVAVVFLDREMVISGGSRSMSPLSIRAGGESAVAARANGATGV